MALSLANVRKLKDELDYLSGMCNDILQTRVRERLFTSATDKEQGYIASQIYPDQYYNFRDFDVNICLVRSRYGEYYVECVNYAPVSAKLRSYPSFKDGRYLVSDLSAVKAYKDSVSVDDFDQTELDKINYERFSFAKSVWYEFVHDYVISCTRDVTTFDFR